jgi:hypothetical protein
MDSIFGSLAAGIGFDFGESIVADGATEVGVEQRLLLPALLPALLSALLPGLLMMEVGLLPAFGGPLSTNVGAWPSRGMVSASIGGGVDDCI